MASLAEKLSALTNPGPEFKDLEEEEEDKVTGAKVTDGDLEGEDEEEEELGRSYLRTVTAGGLEGDERYRGKRLNRKELEKDKDFMEHSGAELGHMFDTGEEEEEGSEEGSEEESDEREGNEEDSNNEGGEMDSEDGENNETFTNEDTIVKVGESDSTYAKGVAVVSQLSSWDKLLEQRILLQKMLTKVNTFPQDLEQFMEPEDREHKELVRQATKSLGKLVQKSVQLKNCMERRGVEECEVVGSNMEEMDEWLGKVAKIGEKGRREKIVMWGDRTQKVGAMSSMNTPTMEQIDQIMSNKARLVKRTKVRRVDCTVLGTRGNKEQEEVNMFDDSDFYHHLLRELIEKKTACGSDSAEVGKQWLQIQKLRSKLKKKVDTRASKGRKVRYDIHTKLVNFMAPVNQPDQMNDTAKNELFSSLFGARKFTAA